MHIILIGFIFAGSSLYNITQVIARVGSLNNNSRTVQSYNQLLLIGKLTKFICFFIGNMLLIFMFSGFARESKKEYEKKKIASEKRKN